MCRAHIVPCVAGVINFKFYQKKTLMKQLLTIAIIFVSTISIAHAQKSPVYATNGIALGGYDAVAFFTQSKPVKGSASYSYSWEGVNWLFADKADLESFKKSPMKFAPAYGGYCAYGTSEGHKAPTHADTWTIVNNKLYFNYNRKVKEMWLKNQSALIDSANRKWPLIMDME
jgi:YHS domain-containing protein